MEMVAMLTRRKTAALITIVLRIVTLQMNCLVVAPGWFPDALKAVSVNSTIRMAIYAFGFHEVLTMRFVISNLM